MQIRNAVPDDIGEIGEIARLAFDDYSESDFLKMIGDKLYRFTVMEENSKIAGFLILLLVDEKSEIIKIATSPDFYRQGVAEALLSDGIEFSKNIGKFGVLLEVKETNTPAKNLYKKLGFDEIFVRKNYYGGKVDASIQELKF